MVVGGEAWHRPLPADWVPIIARDIQRQAEQEEQVRKSFFFLFSTRQDEESLEILRMKGIVGIFLITVILVVLCERFFCWGVIVSTLLQSTSIANLDYFSVSFKSPEIINHLDSSVHGSNLFSRLRLVTLT